MFVQPLSERSTARAWLQKVFAAEIKLNKHESQARTRHQTNFLPSHRSFAMGKVFGHRQKTMMNN